MANPNPKPSNDSLEIAQNIGRVEERLRWHFGVGSTAIAGAICVALFILGWLFVHGLPERFDKIDGQLSAQSTQLAVLTAKIEVLKPEAGKTLASAMSKSLQSSDQELGLRTVAALAKEANDKKISGADPGAVADVGLQVLNQINKSPKLADPAWSATTNILDYLSYLRTPQLEKVGTTQPYVKHIESHFDLGVAISQN